MNTTEKDKLRDVISALNGINNETQDKFNLGNVIDILIIKHKRTQDESDLGDVIEALIRIHNETQYKSYLEQMIDLITEIHNEVQDKSKLGDVIEKLKVINNETLDKSKLGNVMDALKVIKDTQDKPDLRNVTRILIGIRNETLKSYLGDVIDTLERIRNEVLKFLRCVMDTLKRIHNGTQNKSDLGGEALEVIHNETQYKSYLGQMIHMITEIRNEVQHKSKLGDVIDALNGICEETQDKSDVGNMIDTLIVWHERTRKRTQDKSDVGDVIEALKIIHNETQYKSDLGQMIHMITEIHCEVQDKSKLGDVIEKLKVINNETLDKSKLGNVMDALKVIKDTQDKPDLRNVILILVGIQKETLKSYLGDVIDTLERIRNEALQFLRCEMDTLKIIHNGTLNKSDLRKVMDALKRKFNGPLDIFGLGDAIDALEGGQSNLGNVIGIITKIYDQTRDKSYVGDVIETLKRIWNRTESGNLWSAVNDLTPEYKSLHSGIYWEGLALLKGGTRCPFDTIDVLYRNDNLKQELEKVIKSFEHMLQDDTFIQKDLIMPNLTNRIIYCCDGQNLKTLTSYLQSMDSKHIANQDRNHSTDQLSHTDDTECRQDGNDSFSLGRIHNLMTLSYVAEIIKGFSESQRETYFPKIASELKTLRNIIDHPERKENWKFLKKQICVETDNDGEKIDASALLREVHTCVCEMAENINIETDMSYFQSSDKVNTNPNSSVVKKAFKNNDNKSEDEVTKINSNCVAPKIGVEVFSDVKKAKSKNSDKQNAKSKNNDKQNAKSKNSDKQNAKSKNNDKQNAKSKNSDKQNAKSKNNDKQNAKSKNKDKSENKVESRVGEIKQHIRSQAFHMITEEDQKICDELSDEALKKQVRWYRLVGKHEKVEYSITEEIPSKTVRPKVPRPKRVDQLQEWYLKYKLSKIHDMRECNRDIEKYNKKIKRLEDQLNDTEDANLKQYLKKCIVDNERDRDSVCQLINDATFIVQKVPLIQTCDTLSKLSYALDKIIYLFDSEFSSLQSCLPKSDGYLCSAIEFFVLVAGSLARSLLSDSSRSLFNTEVYEVMEDLQKFRGAIAHVNVPETNSDYIPDPYLYVKYLNAAAISEEVSRKQEALLKEKEDLQSELKKRNNDDFKFIAEFVVLPEIKEHIELQSFHKITEEHQKFCDGLSNEPSLKQEVRWYRLVGKHEEVECFITKEIPSTTVRPKQVPRPKRVDQLQEWYLKYKLSKIHDMREWNRSIEDLGHRLDATEDANLKENLKQRIDNNERDRDSVCQLINDATDIIVNLQAHALFKLSSELDSFTDPKRSITPECCGSLRSLLSNARSLVEFDYERPRQVMFILQLLETLSLDDSQIFFAKWLTPFYNRHIQEALDKKEEELQKLKTTKYRSLDDDFEFITEFVVLPEIKEHIESQSFHEITEEHQKFCDGLSDEPSLKQEVRWYRLVGKHEKVECFITKEIPSTTVRPKQVPRPKRVDQLQEWYLKYKLSKIHDMRKCNRSIEHLGHQLDDTEDANLKENLKQRIDNNKRDRDSVCQLINDATIIMVNLQARGALFKLWSELDSFRSITPECCGSLGRLLSNARSLVEFDYERLCQVMFILQLLENRTLSLDDSQIFFAKWLTPFYNRHIQEALDKKKEELQKLKTRKYRSLDDDFEFITEFVVLPEIKEHIESQSFHKITEEHQKSCDELSNEPSLKQQVSWCRLVGKHEKVECFITKEIPSTTDRPKQVPRPKRVDQLQEWYLKYKLSKIHDMREWNRSIEDLGHRLDATKDANLKENLKQRIDNNERDRDSVCQLINDATDIIVNLQTHALFKLSSELDSFTDPKRSITPECCGSLVRLLSNARSLVEFDYERLCQVMFILQLLENRTLSLDDSQIFFAKWLTPFCNRHIQEALDKKEEELQKLKTRKYRSLDDDFEFITEFVVLPEIKEHIESQSFHEITEEHQKFCDGLSDEPSLKQEVRWYRLVGKHEKVECFITKEIPSTTVRPKQVPRPKRVDQLQEWYLKYKLSKIHDMRKCNRSIEHLGHQLDDTEDANLKENLKQRIDNNERDRDSVCQLINDATIIMVNLQARGALFKLWSELDSFTDPKRSITPECCGSLGRLLSNARSLVKFDNKRLRQVMSILQQLENGTLPLDDNQISFDSEFKLFYNRHIQEALNKKKEELQKLKTRKYRSYDDDFEFMTEFVDDFDSSNCVAPKIGVEVLSDGKKAKSKNNDKSEDRLNWTVLQILKEVLRQSAVGL